MDRCGGDGSAGRGSGGSPCQGIVEEVADADVERSIKIKADPALAYESIVNLRQWALWSAWADIDPDMELTYDGSDGEVGSTYSWNGNRKAGAGSMTLTDAKAPTSVVIDLRFLKPFKSVSVTRFDLEPVPDGTEVTWTMTGSYTFLSRIFSLIMPMERLVGRDFEKGLAQLQAHVES